VIPTDEVLGAWLAKESVRDVYLTDDRDDAALLLDKAIAACTNDDVAEIVSLCRSQARWSCRGEAVGRGSVTEGAVWSALVVVVDPGGQCTRSML
jgi:hypothetical protein